MTASRGVLRRRGLPPTCHPDREHAAKGLCDWCYKKDLGKRNPSYWANLKSKRIISKKRRATEHPERYVAYRKRQNLTHTLLRRGISREDYESLLWFQRRTCAICRKGPISGVVVQKLHLDHNHETNEVRGFLCSNCNTALGLLGEGNLLQAIEYLNNPPLSVLRGKSRSEWFPVDVLLANQIIERVTANV